MHISSPHSPWSRGARELIKEYWSRQTKKKGDKAGRKSDPKPKSKSRPVAVSIETTPEPIQVPKKRGRDRPKARPDTDDEGVEEEENTRSKKRGRKSNGTARKASPSPTPSSDRASPAAELLEPSAIKKWGDLPSWEQHIEVIDTVERTDDGDLIIYFKLYDFCLSACTLSDSLGISFVGRVRKQRAKKIRISVPKNSHRWCAHSRPFNFHDLS